jgi:hypothetical protein
MTRVIAYLILILIAIVKPGFAIDTFIVDIYIKDHKFEPSEVRIPKNFKVKLIVHNLDDTIEEFESNDLKREKIVPGKGKVSIILPPLQPGKYYFFGDFHPDTAKGYLIVN